MELEFKKKRKKAWFIFLVKFGKYYRARNSNVTNLDSIFDDVS